MQRGQPFGFGAHKAVVQGDLIGAQSICARCATAVFQIGHPPIEGEQGVADVVVVRPTAELNLPARECAIVEARASAQRTVQRVELAHVAGVIQADAIGHVGQATLIVAVAHRHRSRLGARAVLSQRHAVTNHGVGIGPECHAAIAVDVGAVAQSDPVLTEHKAVAAHRHSAISQCLGVVACRQGGVACALGAAA